MAKVKTYKDLVVWQKSMDMTAMLYQLVKKLPKEETYALSDQMRRAAISVPSNIAEGFGRSSTKEYLHFLFISYGSICELETQLILSSRINYLSKNETQPVMDLLSEIGKMINAIIKKNLTPDP